MQPKPENKPLYHETLTSNLTTGLFIALGVISGGVCAWRVLAVHFDGLAGVSCFFACFFAFYTVNYRKLAVDLSSEMLKLRFGVFRWRVPVENIASCRLDDQLNFIERYGGAGIHFMLADGKYRANYNFLDHPRVLITFKRKVGLVQALSFSSREPQIILDKISSLIS